MSSLLRLAQTRILPFIYARPYARFVSALFFSMCIASAGPAAAGDALETPVPLLDSKGLVSESVLEAFLSPAEFTGRRFVYESKGDEALFALDAVLGSNPPKAELHPERIHWPKIADLDLVMDNKALPMKIREGLTDRALDEGFVVRWTLKAEGQRFSPTAHFAAQVVAAEIVSIRGGSPLADWSTQRLFFACPPNPGKDAPSCILRIGFEVRAVSVSPDGTLVSLAFGGLRPRVEVYDISRSPELLWQALLPKNSGGAVETAFSSDGQWVTALSGKGVMHRFNARFGGEHLAVPSSGITASSVPPGRMMAVAGKMGEVTLWILADGTIDRRIPPRDNRGMIDRVTASANGEVIAALEYAEKKSIIRVWALRSRTLLRQIEIDGRTAVAAALNADGKTLFVSHEDEGLLSLSIPEKGGLGPIGGDAASRCRGRIQWIAGMGKLVCSVKEGLLLLDDRGAVQRFLPIKNESSDWVASGGGLNIAAAGGGQLLLWRAN